MNVLTLAKYGTIRTTEDNRFSVFDTIRVIGGKKNPHETWKRLCDDYPEVLTKYDNFQFPGAGQRLTPVADTEGIFYIIGLLPGSVGHAYREAAAREMCRRFGKRYEDVVSKANNALIPPSPQEMVEVFSAIFGVVKDMDDRLIARFIAEQVAEAHPQYKPYLKAAAPMLVVQAEDEAVTVTTLAKMYIERTGKELSKNNTDLGNAIAQGAIALPIALNKILIDSGLQIENPNKAAKKDGQPAYLPTEMGKEYAQVIFQQGASSKKTIQQLRWYPSVLDVLS
ncbi:hypothetical protein [Scytonema sp. PCC 10023]|uniref:hypothetical protein n=1 Tax=Scytonema sp. PCC 10023 TaxID=1680591 RepID=UPI0039C64303